MTDRARELVERLRHVERLRSAFEQARQRMNDARPDPVHATPAGRALYDERYQAYNIAAFEMACGGFLTQAADLIEQSLTPPEGDTARELVEGLRDIHARLPDVTFGDAWVIEDAADFIEQSLTPPEGDTVSVIAEMLAEWGESGCEEVPHDLAARIAALQSRVSPQTGLREALEKCRDRFAEYVELHRAKLPVQWANAPKDWRDVVAKIERNQEMVSLCDAALATAPIPMSENAVEKLLLDLRELGTESYRDERMTAKDVRAEVHDRFLERRAALHPRKSEDAK